MSLRIAPGLATTVLCGVLAGSGHFAGILAEAHALAAADPARPLRERLRRASKAVATNPHLPEHRRALGEILDLAVADLGVDAVAAAVPDEAMPRIGFAAALARAGRLPAAIPLLAEAVPSDPAELALLGNEEVLSLARASALARRCRAALGLFDEYLARGGSQGRIDLEQGRCLAEVGESAAAVSRLERAHSRAPEARDIGLLLASAKLQTGDLPGVIETTSDLLERDDAFYYAWRLRARTLERLGDFTEAEKAYGRAADLSPEKSFNRVDQARMRLERGDADGAVALLEPLVRSDARDSFATLVLVEAEITGGRVAKARRRALEAADRWPDEPRAWELLGRAREKEHLWREAGDAYARAHDESPETSRYATSAARCWIRAGEPRRAEKILEAVVDRAPADRWATFFLAEARLAMGDLDAADEGTERITIRWSDFYHGWHLRGRVLVATERFAEAADAFERALALAPEKAWISSWIEQLRRRGSENRNG